MTRLAAVLIPFVMAAQQPVTPEADWESTRQAGRKFFEQGQFRQAEPYLEQALAKARAMGAAGPKVAASERDLADYYLAVGKAGEAERLLRSVVEFRGKELGPEHAELAPELDALGWACYHQWKFVPAADHFRRSLAVQEKAKGAQSVEIIPALLNVVRMTQLLKGEEESVGLLQRVIGIRIQARGPEHPEVAGDIIRLARYYQSLDRNNLAEPMFVSAIGLLERSNGPLHVSLTSPLEELANLYMGQKRFAEAEAPLRRSLAAREKSGGPMNPENATVMETLGGVLMELKRFEEAEALYGRALTLWEMKLGDQHPLLAITLDFLGYACASQAKNAAAEKHYRRALLLRERDSVSNLNNVALVLEAQQKAREAEPFYQVALQILEKPAPAGVRPVTAAEPDARTAELLRATLDNYANLLLSLNRNPAAARLQSRVKAMDEAAEGAQRKSGESKTGEKKGGELKGAKSSRKAFR